MKGKGIVVKAKDSHCIILTKEGTYLKVPISRVKNARVGAESEFSSYDWKSQLRPFLMVASILILVLGFGMYKITATPAAAAYVSLDINPSIELEIDDHTKVIGTRAINGDAEQLLDEMQLKGKDLYVSIREIVDRAATKGYIKPNQTNYVLSSVTVEENGSNVINYDNIVKNLQDSVEDKELDVEFVILSADIATRNEAKSQGLSAGKMIVYKTSVSAGEKLTIEQVKQNSLTTLVNTYKIKVLPNNKKAMVKLLHVPPYSERFKKENRHLQDGNNSESNDMPLTSKEDSKWAVRDRESNTEQADKENRKNDASKKENSKDESGDKNRDSVPGSSKEDKQTGLSGTNKDSSKLSQPESKVKSNSDQNSSTPEDTDRDKDIDKEKDTDKDTGKDSKGQNDNRNDKKPEKKSNND